MNNKIRDRGIENIETVQSDCETQLEEDSVDVILLFDIFHLFRDPNQNLRELHRVLKPEGTLSFSDHHMNEESIVNGMTSSGLFELQGQAEHTFSFIKL